MWGACFATVGPQPTAFSILQQLDRLTEGSPHARSMLRGKEAQPGKSRDPVTAHYGYESRRCSLPPSSATVLWQWKVSSKVMTGT